MKFKLNKVRPIKDLRSMLYESAAEFAERDAFLEKRDGEYKGIKFRDFLSDVEGLGTLLLNKGLGGKRVIVLGENCYNWARSYMAVICGVGVVVPVDKEIPAEEIANIADIAEAEAVIYSDKYAEKIIPLMGVRVKIPFSELDRLVSEGRDMIDGGDRSYLDATVDPDVMSSLIFTSGTTGVSKGVMLSQKNICFNLSEMCQMCYIGPGDIFLSVLPLHHAYECTCGFLCQIYRGATVAYCEGLRYIVKNMQEVHPTCMLCVPMLAETMYKKIISGIKKNGMEDKVNSALVLSRSASVIGVDLRKKLFSDIQKLFGGNLRLIIVGGAAADPKVLKGLREFGLFTMQGYGLTECAPLAAVNSDLYYCDSSAGMATPNAELEIENPGEDGSGDIRFKGDNIMLGYYNNKELTDSAIVDGWLYTGDIGYIDRRGFLHITGRKKNVIVTANGKNVFPEELETYLGRNKFVAESVVVGVPTGLDYKIVAMIFPNAEAFREEYPDGYTDEDVNVKIGEAIKSANSMVQHYKYIQDYVIRENEFPKNTSRKIKRIGLTEEAIDALGSKNN